jgi:hypothetical protein
MNAPHHTLLLVHACMSNPAQVLSLMGAVDGPQRLAARLKTSCHNVPHLAAIGRAILQNDISISTHASHLLSSKPSCVLCAQLLEQGRFLGDTLLHTSSDTVQQMLRCALYQPAALMSALSNDHDRKTQERKVKPSFKKQDSTGSECCRSSWCICLRCCRSSAEVVPEAASMKEVKIEGEDAQFSEVHTFALASNPNYWNGDKAEDLSFNVRDTLLWMDRSLNILTRARTDGLMSGPHFMSTRMFHDSTHPDGSTGQCITYAARDRYVECACVFVYLGCVFVRMCVYVCVCVCVCVCE